MVDPNNERTPFGIGLPILLIVGLIFGGLWQSRSTESESKESTEDKPQNPKMGEIPATPGMYSHHAQLWVDPFEYFDVADKALLDVTDETNTHRAARLRDIIDNAPTYDAGDSSKTKSADSKPWCTIIPVMVPGSQMREDVEARIQTREALVQALMSQAYRMKYPKRLTYMRIPFCAKTGRKKSIHSSMVIPVKLYHAEGKEPIFVFWINSDQLGNSPLSAITQIVINSISNQPLVSVPEPPKSDDGKTSKTIVEMLEFNLCECFANSDPNVRHLLKNTDLRILGPPDSEDYQVFEAEDIEWDNGSPFDNGALFHSAKLVSARSTVSGSTLSDDFKLQSGMQCVHYIGTDAMLVSDCIQPELEVRYAWPLEPEDKLVLITERDTIYGESVHANFEPPLLQAPLHRDSLRVIHYIGDKGSSDSTDSSLHTPVNQMKEGMDKLMLEIAAEGGNKRNIKAIGVFGSSTDTKISLLKDARHHYPGAVLFTTDLDAKLIGSERRDIRNTIVASHYGLSLGRGAKRKKQELDQHIPPFQNTYQTATFAAAQFILGHPVLNDAKAIHPQDPWNRSGANADRAFSPLLFELGRFGPFQLPLEKQSELQKQMLQPEPRPRWSYRSETYQMLAVLLILASLTIWVIAQVYRPFGIKVQRIWTSASRLLNFAQDNTRIPSRQLHEESRFKPRGPEIVAFVSILIWILIFAVSVISDQADGGEPISFLEGISVWPSLWLLAIIGSWGAYRVLATREEMKRQIELFPGVAADRLVVGDGSTKTLGASMIQISNACKQFREQLQRGNAARVFIISVALTVIGISLIHIFGVDPSPPTRGLFATIASYVVQSVVAFTLVLMVCQATFAAFTSREHCSDIFECLHREIAKIPSTHKGPWKDESREHAISLAREASRLTTAIGRHSGAVSQPVEVAAALVLLFGLARTDIFDAWENSASALTVLLVMLTVCVGALTILRFNLAQKRNQLVLTMNSLALWIESEKSGEADNIRKLSDAVRSVQKGVFRPVTSDPITRAFVYTSGGIATAP